MGYLLVKNWRKHQHYLNKENPPPWIKLKRALLTDYEVRALSEADRWKLVGLWLLASDKDGTVPDDARYVAACLGVKRIDLNLFVSRGFLERVYTDSRANLFALEVEVPALKVKDPGLRTTDESAGQPEGQDVSNEEIKAEIGQSLGVVAA